MKPMIYLRASDIFRYLSGDEKLHTLIVCKSSETYLMTSDQSLYEAIASMGESEYSHRLLAKLLEVTEIIPYARAMGTKRTVLSPRRVEEIRTEFPSMVPQR